MIAVYKIQSILKPQRIYIGSSWDIDKRWRKHKYSLRYNKHESVKLQRHYNKYGKDDLQFIILEECTKDIVRKREGFYLETLRPYFNTHMVVGSRLGIPHSKETCIKISNSKKGKKHPPCTQERKDKMKLLAQGRKPSQECIEKARIANKGKPTWNKGLRMTDECRKKCSEAHKGIQGYWKGKHLTQETKNKLRESHLGKKRSSETIEKMKKSLAGVIRTEEWGNNISKAKMGHITSEETKEKIRISNIGKKQSLQTIAKRIATQKRNRELKNKSQ